MRGPFFVVARKEARALLPVWAASVITIVADPLIRGTGMDSLFPLGMFAYIVGSLALGAHVIGHEYTNRTLGSLLAQPWKRSSMLLTKAAVLVAMLATLACVGLFVLFLPEVRAFRTFPRGWQLALPIAGGLFVAPYVTIRLRSQMAGVVFTSAIPGTTYLVALLAGVAVYGVGTGAAEALAVAVWPPVMLIFAAAGGVLSARSFLRLQDIEGGGEELRLPRWLAATDRNPIRPPLWMLVKKELRLQQMTFAMAALYVAIWAALTIAGRMNVEFAKEFPIRGVGLLYFALLPLLMGSIASAQERQCGMLESQSMLPIPFAQQWAVKAGVVLVLALTLGVLLPWIVFAPPQLSSHALWPLAATILLLTTWSLYISSWCDGGVIALALILPASAAALVAARSIDWAMTSMLPSHYADGPYRALTSPSALVAVWALIGAPIVALLLVFAGRNHRSLERNPRSLAVQMAWLAAALIVSDFVTVIL